MRAAICRAFGTPLELADVPEPVPGPGEVRIAVEAASVNFPDLLLVQGKYQRLPQLPFVAGMELAGIVDAVGTDVRGLSAGDRVMATTGQGAFAEKAIAAAQQCWTLPDGVAFDVAAAMGLVYQTAWFALVDRAQYKTGETVLVLGAGGGVGMACVQLAAALGAKVLAGVTRPERATLARAAAAAVIDLGAPNLRDRLRDEVSAATDGHMADIVLDPVGGDAFDAALRAVAWEGRVVVIGFAAGRIPEVKANYLLLKNIAVIGMQWSDYRTRQPERCAEVQQELFALLQAGKIAPHIDARLPLTRADEALQRVARGEVLGKLVLLPQG